MSDISPEKYLDGIVSAISRVGLLLFTLSLISGLILVVSYVDNFSFDDAQLATVATVREQYSEEVTKQKVALEGARRQLAVAKTDKEIDDAKAAIRDSGYAWSYHTFKIARIDNELKKVGFGKVKIPILNHEVPTNDAAVVLGFFLVIISIVALITVKHVNHALDDAGLSRIVRENILFLRSRLILIYAPISSKESPKWILVIFFLPCVAMLVATVEIGMYFQDVSFLRGRHILEAAVTRLALLVGMTIFLGYVGYSLLNGWTRLRATFSQAVA